MGLMDLEGHKSWVGNSGVNFAGAFGKGIPASKIKGWSGSFLPEDTKTSREAIVAAKLDWVVDRHPIIQVDPIYGIPTVENPSGVIGWEPRKGLQSKVNGLPTGGYAVSPTHVMNVRRDTGRVLGHVGRAWTGPQNDEAMSFIDSLVGSGEAKYLAGGPIDGGRKVWLCAQIARDVLLGGDVNERCIPLLFLSNGWDGGTSFTITTAPYRLLCLNGMTAPVAEYVRCWRGRHTSGLTAEKRLAVARKTLEMSVNYFDHWAVEMEKLMTKTISPREVEKSIVALFPDPKPAGADGNLTDRQIRGIEKKREALLTTYRDTDNLQHLGHTAYRFYNAVTDLADWGSKVDDSERMLNSALPMPIKDHAFALMSAL